MRRLIVLIVAACGLASAAAASPPGVELAKLRVQERIAQQVAHRSVQQSRDAVQRRLDREQTPATDVRASSTKPPQRP